MQVPVSEAKARLTDLVRRAEQGEEVVLTRHGEPAVRIVPVRSAAERAARYGRLMAIAERAAGKAAPGPDAAHISDEHFDGQGEPR